MPHLEVIELVLIYCKNVIQSFHILSSMAYWSKFLTARDINLVIN